ncbi:hypothetical protein LJB96_03240 [Methanobrevibacter sp. OttesenSCG-928-K11]|nr:hypothetical protein [Methanobrevibacter sp. OttesenSCG-928-K11]MDL2270772.1 hypothetical protein [Methanobrevibacter sp. OttesenSCG-928-I08]
MNKKIISLILIAILSCIIIVIGTNSYNLNETTYVEADFGAFTMEIPSNIKITNAGYLNNRNETSDNERKYVYFSDNENKLEIKFNYRKNISENTNNTINEKNTYINLFKNKKGDTTYITTIETEKIRIVINYKNLDELKHMIQTIKIKKPIFNDTPSNLEKLIQ